MSQTPATRREPRNPQAKDAPIADAEQAALDLAVHTHRYLNDAVRLADAKAGIILGLSGSLMSWGVVRLTEEVANRAAGWVPSATAFSLALCPLAAGVLWTLGVVAPRFFPTREPDLVFWTDIRAYDQEVTYLQASVAADRRRATEAIASHNWTISRILADKYPRLRRSLIGLEVGGVLMLIGLLVRTVFELAG